MAGETGAENNSRLITGKIKRCPVIIGCYQGPFFCSNHAMYLINRLAEEKIAEAIERGELDNLPGTGKPLQLDDDTLVPEDLRAGFRLLKNAGYLAPGLQLRKEIGSVEALIAQARSLEERDVLNRRLRYLMLQLSVTGSDTPLLAEQQYLDKIRNRL